MSYAKRTKVSSEQSMAAVCKLLAGRGAKDYTCGVQDGHATANFRWKNWIVRVQVPIPTKGGDQKVKQMWRLLLAILKFRFESIEAGGRVFEQEFLSDIVTTTGETVFRRLVPQLDRSSGPLMLTAPEVTRGQEEEQEVYEDRSEAR